MKKALADSNEIIERNSQLSSTTEQRAAVDAEKAAASSQSNQDLLKLVEEYSRQSELKTKEIEAASAKMTEKKAKMALLKKDKLELHGKLGRVESKL